jgi:hypothetical protein
MDNFCKKVNLTGAAKIAFDNLNSTVIEQTKTFSYNPANNTDSVIYIFIYVIIHYYFIS